MAPYRKPLTNWVTRKRSFLTQKFATKHMLLRTFLTTNFLAPFWLRVSGSVYDRTHCLLIALTECAQCLQRDMALVERIRHFPSFPPYPPVYKHNYILGDW